MGIEIVSNGKVVHRSSFSICQISTLSEEVGPQKKIMAFSFKGGRVFQDEFRTAPTETIEGNIWQAGSDPDVILFGISFSAHNQVLLNTIHIAKALSETTSALDRGLTVRTFPIRRKGAK